LVEVVSLAKKISSVDPKLIVNYFGSGAIMDGGMHGRMNQNDWMGGHSWKWFPTIVTFFFGVLIGLLFRKKN